MSDAEATWRSALCVPVPPTVGAELGPAAGILVLLDKHGGESFDDEDKAYAQVSWAPVRHTAVVWG